LRWRLGKVGMPLVLAMCLLFAAGWVPLPSAGPAASATPRVPPMAWQQVEQWIEQLRKDEVVQPESLARIEQQLHSLQQQPPAQWYAHASLEAGASLQARTEQSLRALGQELARTKAAAEAARQSGLSNPEAAREAAARATQALAQLDAGALNPSSALADAMRQLAESGELRPLDASQLGAVCDQLGRGIAGVEKCLGPGSCQLEGKGDGLETGQGGITRGPGEKPLGIGEASPPVAGNREAMESDPRRAALGDVVREQLSAPEIDATGGSAVGGAVSGAGQGGEAVARQALVPAEGEILKRYFK
jgi:hypothetical protein